MISHPHRATVIGTGGMGTLCAILLARNGVPVTVWGRSEASVVAAAADLALAETIQRLFSNRAFRVYTSRDLVGVEVAGAVKNIVAIAAGICDGIEAGDNAKAALLTRGLVEITRLGVALGAEADTFKGLAGVGDLFTTCVSKIGRNRTAGERIGRGEHPEHVIATTASVIEGIPTTRAVLDLAANHQIDMPIVAAVASILFDGCPPREAINRLMTRMLRSEFTWATLSDPPARLQTRNAY